MDTFNVGGLKSSLEFTQDDEGVFRVSDMKDSLLDIAGSEELLDVDMMDISMDQEKQMEEPVKEEKKKQKSSEDSFQSSQEKPPILPKMNELVIRREKASSTPEKTAMSIEAPANLENCLERPDSNTKFHILYFIYWCIQILVHLITWSVVFYIIYFLFKCFAADVDGRRQYQQANMAIEITSCLKNYVTNKCMPNQRAPMLEIKCMEWEKCLNLDPDTHISTLKLCAEVLLDILSVFIEPLKNLSYGAYLGLFICYLSVLTFNHYRGETRTRGTIMT